MLIVDAHEDLAWNILTFDRDYSYSAEETRQRELGTIAPLKNGDTMLGWKEYQTGNVAVIFATLFAAPVRRKLGEWDILCYRDDSQAETLYRDQIDVYQKLVDVHPDKFSLIKCQKDLEKILAGWQGAQNSAAPVGLVLLMEGAESIREIGELEEWHQKGVRIIGPAWTGNRFCGGTNEPGPLTQEGRQLLDGMASMGLSLDISHMDELSALQALDYYPGRVIATHANVQSVSKIENSNRHLTDQVLSGLLEREGVVGVVPFNEFLKPGWKTGDNRDEVSLNQLIAHIDSICQLAGNAEHVGLGTDFDGGFGLQSTPVELKTIADLQQLVALLFDRGYSKQEINGIMGQNWINFLLDTLM